MKKLKAVIHADILPVFTAIVFIINMLVSSGGRTDLKWENMFQDLVEKSLLLFRVADVSAYYANLRFTEHGSELILFRKRDPKISVKVFFTASGKVQAELFPYECLACPDLVCH